MIGQLLERAFLCGQLILSLAEVVKQSLYAGWSWGWVKNLEPGGKERFSKPFPGTSTSLGKVQHYQCTYLNVDMFFIFSLIIS